MPEAEVSLREFVKDSEGIFFAGKGITWEQMIKIWAQQMGLSHESEDVDPALVALHQLQAAAMFSFQPIGKLERVSDGSG